MTTDVFHHLQAIIVDLLGVAQSQVTPEARFREDLGADSIDHVELMMAIEEFFGIEISDEEAQTITTVGEAVRYIEVRSLIKSWPAPKVSRKPSRYDYDIAISYAGEDRSVAEEISSQLSKNNVRVFYDRNDDIQASLWGKDLYSYFAELYSKRARYCLIVISSNYAKKVWTKHELRAAQERALKESAEGREYILPLRLDDTEIPGIFSTTDYVDWRVISHDTIIKYVLIKLKEAG
jgi:acyl carrier protein